MTPSRLGEIWRCDPITWFSARRCSFIEKLRYVKARIKGLSKHNTLILVGMFSQREACGVVEGSTGNYFLLRRSKELAMKSRRGKARRISAASFPGFECFLTTFSLLPSSISAFLLPAASPETQVSPECITCGRNEKANKLPRSVNLKQMNSWIESHSSGAL